MSPHFSFGGTLSKKESNDKYYTNPEYAEYIVRKVKSKYGDCTYVEPSAGKGSFSKLVSEIVCYDLEPDADFEGPTPCIQADFLSVYPKADVFIGNPPFGKNSSLACKFFNHCASLLEVGGAIAFILPRTFEKIFFANRLDMSMHLTYSERCPKNSFFLNRRPYDVPCVFQIWEKKEYNRDPVEVGENKLFAFGTPEDYDFCVRRVGYNAGKVLEDDEPKAEESTYFIKSLVEGIDTVFVECYASFQEEAGKTAGMKSLGKKELQYILEARHDQKYRLSERSG